MPVIHKIEHKDGQRSAVWEVQEDEYALLEMVALNPADATAFALIANRGRRLEWLAVRTLLKELYPGSPAILYSENGKPQLANDTTKISISHSGKMVAIALHPSKIPGIDIEMLNPRIYKIASRFISDSEKNYLGDNPTFEQLTIIWGAKEVLFKVYEHGSISFKDDFRINPFLSSVKGKLTGIIQKNGEKAPIPMEYMQIGTYMMVHTNYSYRDFENISEL